MRLEEVPDPKPQAGQVVVRLRAIGVNPVETYIRSGIYGPVPMPFTPGSDGGGEVLAVGSGVTKVKPGDRVYVARSISGAYAEQVLCTEAQVHPLPPSVSFEQGAAVGIPYGTAFRAMFQIANVLPGETMLVHGASGGVGTAAVQLGRARGVRVFGTAGTDKGRKLVVANGAEQALDHSNDGYLKQLVELTGGRGVNVIIEMLANKNLGKDLPLLALHGRVVVVGSRGPVEIDARNLMGRDGRSSPAFMRPWSPGSPPARCAPPSARSSRWPTPPRHTRRSCVPAALTGKLC
jgi:NADPH2:quinone reductase